MNSFRLTFYKNKILETKKKEIKIIKRPTLTKSNFKFHMIIGRGGFGKVWVVSFKNKKKYYALKEMSKAKIIHKRSVKSVMNEKNIISTMKDDFLVNMKCSF